MTHPGQVWGAPREVTAGKSWRHLQALQSLHASPGPPCMSLFDIWSSTSTFIWKKDSTACMSLGVTQVERAERKQFVSSHGWLEGSGVGCTSRPLHSWVSIIHPPRKGMKSQHPTYSYPSVNSKMHFNQISITWTNIFWMAPKWFCPWKQIPKRSLSQIIWVCNLCHKLEA